MAEFIGSRIALISKSEIRYVGTLREINSETATVSLEQVTCQGTEGRIGDPNREIAASDQVYEGIVFRGSDVKDLRILAAPSEKKAPQMPNDPAIVATSQPAPAQEQQQQQPQQQPQPQQLQQQPPNQYRGGPPYQQHNQFGFQGPPPNQFQQPSQFQGPGGPHGFPGSPGAIPGYGMRFGGPAPGYGMGMGYGPPPGQGFQQPSHAPFHQQQQMPIGTPDAQQNQQRPHPPPQQPAPVGSKQGTPQPQNDQAPQPPQPPKPADTFTTPAASAPTTSAPPPPLDSKPAVSTASAPTTAALPPPAAVASKAAQRANSRVAVPLPAPHADPNRARPKPPAGQQIPAVAAALQVQAPAVGSDAATAAVAAAMAKLAMNNPVATGNDNLAQKVNQLRAQDHQSRGRGRGRGGVPRGGRRESAQKTVEVPKEDFDFESANAKFNKQELAKEAIATGSHISGPITSALNGTAPAESAPSPSNTAITAAAAAVQSPPTNGHQSDEADDVVIPAKPAAERGYDKKSSFFDNISSDLKDRVEPRGGSEPVDGRSMRREERSKNMETFGQGSVDGGYRGRGRGRGRGGFGRSRGYFGGGGGGGGRGAGQRGRGRGGAETATQPL